VNAEESASTRVAANADRDASTSTPVDAEGGASTSAAGIRRRLAGDTRWIALAGLVALAALAWAVLMRFAASMDPAMGAMPMVHRWDAAEVAALFAMWVVMMVAMMTPSAAPVVLLVVGMNRRRRERGERTAPTPVFLLGYLLVWTAFAAVAAAVQAGLHNAALLSPAMAAVSPWLGSSILVAAGLYQWSPLKRACLSHCRSPLHVLTVLWREGASGALRMGVVHGAWCLGCCWLLMALLFVAGVMNLVWVAAIAALVLVETAAPGGEWAGRLAGAALVGWGGWLVLAA
jgi:predicted metal-binding membrane protein